jgi:hydroxyacyl-ACP dehydratase HTD2-like protein with hotdog domain
MMREHMDVPPLGGLVPPGYQQVSHNRLEPEWHLCEDGAQLKYSPGSEYKYRVWSGGSMDFNVPFMPQVQEPVTADERFESCRILRNGDDNTGRAWVHIVQDFRSSSGRNVPAAFDSSEDDRNVCLVSEKKGLLFFKEIPDSLKSKEDSRSTQPVPGKAIRQLTMMPTPVMLFRFSALTFNSHAIHLDREFTKSVYGIPDLLVHGPLTSVLMLEMLRTAFAELGFDNKADYFIKHFEYRNHKPLWVNEEITIGCKRIITDRIAPRFQLSDGERRQQFQREMWQVCISKGTGENKTLAVEGTAAVSVALHEISPLNKWRTLDRAKEAATPVPHLSR